jgi:hypothetical protein
VTEKNMLPLTYVARKGGNFDLASLKYVNNIWKKDDPNCCPSGGRIVITFKFEKGQVIIDNANYDPNYSLE